MCDKYARIISKRVDGVPTVPPSPDHRAGDWVGTDIYEGELAIDTNTGKLYTNVGGAIVSVSAASTRFVPVASASDFPAAVANVITLADNTTYLITADIDLAGDRLVCGDGTVLMGIGMKNCSIDSTGAGAVSLITATKHLTILDIKLLTTDATSTLFDIDGDGQDCDLYMERVWVKDVTLLGEWQFIDHGYIKECHFDNSTDLDITSTCLSMTFEFCQFDNRSTGTLITLGATTTITDYIKFDACRFDIPTTTTGIDVNASATIRREGYILNACYFTGAGTMITGMNYTDDETMMYNNVGIKNRTTSASAYMQANGTATTVALADTYYKVAGTTTAGGAEKNFGTGTTNRYEADAEILKQYMAHCTLKFNGGVSENFKFAFYDSGTASILTPSSMAALSDANGDGNCSFFVIWEPVAAGDYLEVHGKDVDTATNFTVSDMIVTLHEIQ